MTQFALTDKHISLLQAAYVEYGGDETGAPAINGKRPYGNGDVVGDVVRILFGDLPEDAKDALRDYAMQLHKETAIALQIVLFTKSFRPGIYTKEKPYGRGWVLLDSQS